MCVALAVPATGAARTETAALEHALRAGGFYTGRDLTAVLTARARPQLGSRALRRGTTGWDVAELQLALAWQGFPSAVIDGRFGARVRRALVRFQRSVGLRADGIAGPETIAALRRRPPGSPIPLGWPLLAPVGDGFGPRGARFHEGIDLVASFGTEVIAAAPGRVSWAGPRAGGWGILVTLAHGRGVRTLYAHHAVADVKVGQWVAGGTVLGRVGSTGNATGPHLHFEVRVGDAAVDPLDALVPLVP
jgi:murein DD-endopeptidase MepM/ murein hydrolase activator NlpD